MVSAWEAWLETPSDLIHPLLAHRFSYKQSFFFTPVMRSREEHEECSGTMLQRFLLVAGLLEPMPGSSEGILGFTMVWWEPSGSACIQLGKKEDPHTDTARKHPVLGL